MLSTSLYSTGFTGLPHGKNKIWKRTLLVITIVGIFLLVLVSPHGLISVENPPSTTGTQALLNPELTDGHAWWSESDWSSSNFYPTNAKHETVGDRVTMSQSGYLPSFYAVALSQGAGPTEFGWAAKQIPHVSINSSFRNVVFWRGSIDYTSLQLVGCLAMGIDFWFDAKLPNGTLAPVEMYVFFYMEGVYALPAGSFKTVLRQDYNHSSGSMGMAWDYIYFHPYQDRKNTIAEHSFELHDFIAKLKHAKPVYAQADFTLTRVDACMEMFMAEGTFTVDYVGLTQSPR